MAKEGHKGAKRGQKGCEKKGQLLFVIYINDLGLSLQNHNEIILFADDTNIFVKAKSLKLAYQAAINELLRQFNDYVVCNKLQYKS